MTNLRRRLKTLAAAMGGAMTLSLAACTNTSDSADTGMVTYVEPNMFNNLYPPSGGYYPNGGVLNNITDRLLWQDPETLELHP